MAYAIASKLLRARIPEVLAAYRTGLLRVQSPLATSAEAWSQCSRQAANILNECVEALTLPSMRIEETGRQEEYTKLLGSHRALQRISAAESVRAVEILWFALEPAIQLAAASEPLVDRPDVWRRVNAAFRIAAGGRLHAGMLGYEETRSRLLAAGAGEPGPWTAADDYSPAAPLTIREREVLEAAARAMTNRQIARSLGIAEPTVKRHLSNVFAKLGVNSRMDAVHRVFGGGISS